MQNLMAFSYIDQHEMRAEMDSCWSNAKTVSAEVWAETVVYGRHVQLNVPHAEIGKLLLLRLNGIELCQPLTYFLIGLSIIFDYAVPVFMACATGHEEECQHETYQHVYSFFALERRSQQNYGLSLSSVVGGEAENVQDALYSSDGDEEMMEVAAEDEVENANRAHQRKEEQTKRRKPVLDIPDCAQDERGAFVVCLRMQPTSGKRVYNCEYCGASFNNSHHEIAEHAHQQHPEDSDEFVVETFTFQNVQDYQMVFTGHAGPASLPLVSFPRQCHPRCSQVQGDVDEVLEPYPPEPSGGPPV
ncbi:hypothetical protein RB195_018192 [Necator americanus]|uniref:C2H2-type domain-containing protein n=1 Tax=Necator americanus TaxID=51031 RepID=A0ABR1CB02_NECAM